MPTPEHTKQSIDDYVERGYRPGGFLTAVLCNDLNDAVAKADEENARELASIVRYVYNTVPVAATGSLDAITAWKGKQ
jgi:hypothetical protein